VTETVDPLAGSYYVESLTDKICSDVYVYLDKIEQLGGMVRAIEKGYVQKEIQDSSYHYQREIEEEKRIVVGVNKFQTEGEPPKDLLKLDPKVQELQLSKLEEVKKSRDGDAVDSSLTKLRNAAADDGENLIPLILEAVKVYATMGEICDQLRAVFGEHKESIVL